MFLWKAMNGALPVGENLKARNINTTVRCPYCREEDTTTHLLFHCLIASDSQQLIKAINKEIPPKELHGILHDILDLSRGFGKIVFVYVSREENRQADVLAKQALIDFVI